MVEQSPKSLQARKKTPLLMLTEDAQNNWHTTEV